MAKDWEYAKATKWIAEHGGSEKALETVKNYYMKKGFKEGAASKNLVIALVGAVCLATGATGKCVYDKIMEKKALEIRAEAAEQAKVKKAEAELVTPMKQDTKAETEAVGESEENSLEPTGENTRISSLSGRKN